MPPAINTLPLYGSVTPTWPLRGGVHVRGERSESTGRGIVFLGRVQVDAAGILAAFDQHGAVESRSSIDAVASVRAWFRLPASVTLPVTGS